MTTEVGPQSTVRCAVCTGDRFITGVFECLWRCQACGHVFYPENPRSAPSELYDEDYFNEEEYLDYSSQQHVMAKTFNRYLRLMRRYGATGGRLYEIGCAYGFFLHEARRTFEVEGIDVSAQAVAYGKDHLRLPVTCGEFADVRPRQPYDAMCLWDTIEHVRHPGTYVAKAHELLRDGGCLFLTTGDLGSPLARLQGPRWRQIHPPTHLHYFSTQTIRHLLNRVGFDVLGIHRVGIHREVKNVLYSLSRLSKGSLMRRMAGGLFEQTKALWGHAALYINLFDLMFVAARKR